MDFMISLFGSEQTGKARERRKFLVSEGSGGNLSFCEDHHSSPSHKVNFILGDLPPEDEEGNVEYKLKLFDPSPSRFEHLVTQMKWRLREGQGEAIYEIGVEDNGLLAGLTDNELDASLSTLRKMAQRLEACVTILREREVDEVKDGIRRRVLEVLIRQVPENQQFIDLRVAVLGSADSGKSTLLGVLTQGEMDNGRGKARLNLFRHLHEIQSGRTSSISLDILGYGADGDVITHQDHSVEEILTESTKLVTFVDLAGHQKYLKTTIFGLTGYSPDYVMLLVAATTGIVSTSREHLGLAMALELPVFVVVTKLDLVSPSVLQRTLAQVESVLKGPGVKRIPLQIRSEDDAINVAANFNTEHESVVPIFAVSSVTGENLDLLTRFLNVIHPKSLFVDECLQELAEFQIDEVFNIPSIGVVAAGLVVKGIVREGDTMLIGPSTTGEFFPAPVESVRRNKATCRIVRAGQAASLALGDLKAVTVRRGMVLVSDRARPRATMSFEAKVFVLYHPSASICKGFQTTMHIGNVRQTAFITSLSKPCLKTNESATVTFKFLRQPEYITEGSRLLFREGKTKGIGHVTRVLFNDEDPVV